MAIGVVGALLGVAACSSGASHSTTIGGPRTVRVHITTSDSFGKPETELTETGAFDFTRGIGEYEFVLNPGSKSESRVEMIVHGRTVLQQLTKGSRPPVLHAVLAGKGWIHYPTVVDKDEPTGVNPYTELARLRAAHDDLLDHGMTPVDGQLVRHYSAQVTRTPLVPGQHSEQFAYDLYVDGHDRVVRLVVENAAAHSRDQIDYSDFGAPVHVTLPPASDIAQYSSTVAPTPKLRGAWAQVASGRNLQFSWKLFHVAADVDRECWSFEATPPLDPSSFATTGVATITTKQLSPAQMRAAMGSRGPWPRHDGHDVTCTRTGVWRTDLQPIANGTAGANAVLVAVLAPDVVSLTEGPGFGVSRRPVPIVAGFHGFVDLTPPPPLSPSGSYELTRRNGSHTTCDASSLSTALFATPFDPCSSAFAPPKITPP